MLPLSLPIFSTSAMYNVSSWFTICWFEGRNLQQMDLDMDCYSKQMKDLARINALDYTVSLWQGIHCLMGRTENPTLLQGELIDDFEECAKLHQPNLPWVLMTMGQQLHLYNIFGEYEKAADVFCEKGYDFPKFWYVRAGPCC